MTLQEMEARTVTRPIAAVRPRTTPNIILVEDEVSGTVQYMVIHEDGSCEPLEDVW